ncbi:LysM peptidoglycan-binding domain-containing protein [Thermodesulfobacteriota bacterium]
MDQNSELDMEDITEEMSEDLELDRELDEDRYRNQTSEGFSSGNKTLVYGALGILVLVVFFMFFFGSGSEVSREDLDAIGVKLETIEKRLSQLQIPEDDTDQVAAQFEKIEKNLAKIYSTSRSLKKRVDQLSSRIDQVQKQRVAKRPAPETARRFHTVSRGETLYGISKKYDISLTQLRRLNKLSTTQEIYPGQKLLVVPAGP